MEYATCAQCEEPILRLDGGVWEHVDARGDWGHMPEPPTALLTEEQAERELREAVERSNRLGLVDAGDGLHYDPTAADFVKVIELKGDYL